VIVVAVPVKDLVNAKQRLTPVLTAPERAALARAMLGDVLRALRGARADQVWVITRDAAVSGLARGLGARVVAEDENHGHTAAVKSAQATASAEGARVFVTVPGDVPCVRPTEIDALVAAARARVPGVAFAPSRSGLGTNGAALAPPDVMALRFGEPSFADHLASARSRGLEPRTLDLRGLGLDIDDAADLRALLVEGATTESAQLLASWGIADRLATGVDPART